MKIRLIKKGQKGTCFKCMNNRLLNVYEVEYPGMPPQRYSMCATCAKVTR